MPSPTPPRGRAPRAVGAGALAAALPLLAGGCAAVLPSSVRGAVGGEEFAEYSLEGLGALCDTPEGRYTQAKEAESGPPHSVAVFLDAPEDDRAPDRFELTDLEGESSSTGRNTVTGWTPEAAEDVELLACVEGQGPGERLGECLYQDSSYSAADPSQRTVAMYAQRFSVHVRELATGEPVYEDEFEIRQDPGTALGGMFGGACPTTLEDGERTPSELYSVPGGSRLVSELWEAVEGR
ncbi:hypothetical protein [Nocardiopsis suaedae]|uniref:Lipoprotein n=1 Tax=Nocardiopsis suaedae TaxID=3018444 RepID=A0ABT4TH29_9ACTN|nr:hypothetical protein [Nocardiopsis suaedae]MDA2804013.1 hypothetical protein [Nocardiopsis suaedae]